MEEEGGAWSRMRNQRKVQAEFTENAIKPSKMKAEELDEKTINIYMSSGSKLFLRAK